MLVLCFIVLFCSVNCDSEEDNLVYGLNIGNAIDVFEKFGHLSIYMRVVPPFVPSLKDTRGWLFRRPTLPVFRDVERYSIAPTPRSAKTLFDGEFSIEFCDNLQQLLQAYFRDFSIEGLERPWRAFTAGWLIDIMALNLGIDPAFIHPPSHDHRYVLIRASRFRERRKLSDLPGNIDVDEDVTEAIQKINIEDMSSLAVFIRNYGSHYISSYVTGNSLYQVFVFSRRVYARIKKHVKTSGMSDIPIAEINNIYSPLFALHVGAVKVASGNKTVKIWAAEHLLMNNIFSYHSLLKLHGKPALLRSLDTLLGNEALLQLELKTLSPAFKDVKKKKWFEEVIDNSLKLWDGNI